MINKTTSEKHEESLFWSPWIVFLFGIPFAALNWWRMDKRGKSIFFLILSSCVYLITSWSNYKGGITPTDHTLSSKIILARLFLAVAFAALLAINMSIDIQNFKKDRESLVPVKWQNIFLFWAIPVVTITGTWTVLDYGAREMGKCRFPRLQDIIYQNELEQRTGVANLVFGRNDFSCDWVWDVEILEPISTDGYRLILIGESNNKNEGNFQIREEIFQYEKVTMENFSEVLEKSNPHEGLEYFVKVQDPGARYSKIECVRFDKFTVCNFAFGYQKTISRFELTFSGLSDKQINDLIQSIVSISTQRIQEYEEK